MSGVRTATPNDVYTQQGTKPACQENINAKISHLILAQLPRTTLTHSKAPNPHARTTSTQNFRISYWHSYPEHSLHTASCPNPHARKTPTQNIFAPPVGTATPNTVYTQQGANLHAKTQNFQVVLEHAPQPLLEALTAPTIQSRGSQKYCTYQH